MLFLTAAPSLPVLRANTTFTPSSPLSCSSSVGLHFSNKSATARSRRPATVPPPCSILVATIMHLHRRVRTPRTTSRKPNTKRRRIAALSGSFSRCLSCSSINLLSIVVTNMSSERLNDCCTYSRTTRTFPIRCLTSLEAFTSLDPMFTSIESASRSVEPSDLSSDGTSPPLMFKSVSFSTALGATEQPKNTGDSSLASQFFGSCKTLTKSATVSLVSEATSPVCPSSLLSHLLSESFAPSRKLLFLRSSS
mmetsp:Transcript_23904/g.42136  ORF Transcript_23904/g.42136 Transcript_23904/m.42136 type:complete len:251 (-) Transcript_23904:456-1208(-)